ncbi:MAG TPA: NAD(P)-dependent alcohol dehydrogenase [Microbacterium sp.]|uniref:NAD(P)-dependent alcohol dehydrogenase n=1 Tax=Microbacterium sp. TaxID=51671 RepID=UPI002B6A7272|nr:NAD(P)-dependent alcohol dehydrogenase [Microbacterium sp.]HWI30565.1 NAD(P)-dependent alcohol dehydrogenase [Microbacterium sp.]
MNTKLETRTMHAWTQTRYGAPDAVQDVVVDIPLPGPLEVVVRVRASSINAADIHIMRGEPLLLRAFFGMRRPRVGTRGRDVSGTVVAVGSGVADLAIGDEVLGELAGGGLAEYVKTPADQLVRRPGALDPVAASALPLAGGTAWQAVELGGVAARQRVLVIGASGGVGTYTVQLAALRGAEVWALCGARSRKLVEDLGAARTFDYKTTDAAGLPAASFDAILDIAGTAPLRRLRSMLRPGGTLVLVSGEGGRLLGPIGRILRAGLLSRGAGGRRIRPLAARTKPELTAELAALAAEGRIRAAIERTWPLSEARNALAHVDAGHTVGKVVVVMAPA